MSELKGDTSGFRRTAIIAEVHAERDRQDAQWGGPEHDDRHSFDDWFAYIRHQIGRWVSGRSAGREALIKIAAIAIAAIESIDRQSKRSDR